MQSKRFDFRQHHVTFSTLVAPFRHVTPCPLVTPRTHVAIIVLFRLVAIDAAARAHDMAARKLTVEEDKDGLRNSVVDLPTLTTALKVKDDDDDLVDPFCDAKNPISLEFKEVSVCFVELSYQS